MKNPDFFIFKALLLCGVLFASKGYANEDSVIRGIVRDQQSGEPISFANVSIPEKNLVTACNIYGEFNLNIGLVDSLIFSAIGYEEKIVHLTDSVYHDLSDLKIMMHTKVYELSEVDIHAFPTYEELKRGILNYKMTPEEIRLDALAKAFQRNMAMLGQKAKKDPLRYLNPSVGLFITSPITAVYDLFSRDVKNQKKYHQLLEADQIKYEVGQRINFEVVSRLTGLKDEKKVADFIAYCNFPDAYVLACTDIELYNSIVERYKEYIALD